MKRSSDSCSRRRWALLRLPRSARVRLCGCAQRVQTLAAAQQHRLKPIARPEQAGAAAGLVHLVQYHLSARAHSYTRKRLALAWSEAVGGKPISLGFLFPGLAEGMTGKERSSRCESTTPTHISGLAPHSQCKLLQLCTLCCCVMDLQGSTCVLLQRSRISNPRLEGVSSQIQASSAHMGTCAGAVR